MGQEHPFVCANTPSKAAQSGTNKFFTSAFAAPNTLGGQSESGAKGDSGHTKSDVDADYRYLLLVLQDYLEHHHVAIGNLVISTALERNEKQIRLPTPVTKLRTLPPGAYERKRRGAGQMKAPKDSCNLSQLRQTHVPWLDCALLGHITIFARR